MQLRKFLLEIEKLKPTISELTEKNIPISESDKWEIDILDNELNAYDGPIFQMVYCLDQIKLFQGFEQLNEIDEDSPEPYKIWGINSNYNFYYAYNYKTDEIVLLDDIKSPEPNMYCATSGTKLLDMLIVVAYCERLRLLNPIKLSIEKESLIEQATKAAGGNKYKTHCKVLIG